MSEDTKTEMLYKEYVRLNQACEEHIRSSLKSFNYVGAIVAFLCASPLAALTDVLGSDRPGIGREHCLFYFFSAIALATAVLWSRDMIRQSLIFYYLKQIKHIEGQLQDGPFALGTDWEEWFSRVHICASGGFVVLFSLILIGFPFVVLLFETTSWKLPICYLVVVGVSHGLCWTIAGMLAKRRHISEAAKTDTFSQGRGRIRRDAALELRTDQEHNP